MAFLRAVAFAFALSLALLLVAPVQWLARRRGWAAQRAIQLGFCRVMCAIIGIHVVAHGRLAGAGPRLVVANHVSWTDIIALSCLHPFVFLAKSEVANWPLLGLLARLQGTVFVDRADRRDIPRVNAALRAVLAEGCDIVVFPEGTSSDGAGVLPFNASHFAMLRDLGAEAPGLSLVPLAIAYAEGADARAALDVGWYGDMTFLPHLWSLMKRGGVACHIVCGAPIDVAGQDRKRLAAAAEAEVKTLLAGLRAPAV